MAIHLVAAAEWKSRQGISGKETKSWATEARRWEGCVRMAVSRLKLIDAAWADPTGYSWANRRARLVKWAKAEKLSGSRNAPADWLDGWLSFQGVRSRRVEEGTVVDKGRAGWA